MQQSRPGLLQISFASMQPVKYVADKSVHRIQRTCVSTKFYHLVYKPMLFLHRAFIDFLYKIFHSILQRLTELNSSSSDRRRYSTAACRLEIPNRITIPKRLR